MTKIDMYPGGCGKEGGSGRDVGMMQMKQGEGGMGNVVSKWEEHELDDGWMSTVTVSVE